MLTSAKSTICIPLRLTQVTTDSLSNLHIYQAVESGLFPSKKTDDKCPGIII
ncbi:hypothetical protein MNBD_GAMMA19-1865 [hydrothermal vent metagenome]|uniref:Uncharacterized protein n=1 Tax=hydrothermal vent metagenome TaxID=652676 RepID=A0A3B1AD20_9ZZZZ